MLDLTNKTDEELVELYKNGEKQACEVILDRYKPLVSKLSTGLFLIGGGKEDLLQEGMIGLFRAVTDFDPSSGVFFSFASLCIKRQMIRAIENSNRKKHGPLNSSVSIFDNGGEEIDEALGDGEPDPEMLFIEAEDTRIRYEKLVSSLSPLERKVFYVYMDGKDYHEIARVLGKSEKSIDNCMQRIKAKAKGIV